MNRRHFLASGGSLVVKWSDYNGSPSASVWDNIVLSEQAIYVLNGCQQ